MGSSELVPAEPDEQPQYSVHLSEAEAKRVLNPVSGRDRKNQALAFGVSTLWSFSMGTGLASGEVRRRGRRRCGGLQQAFPLAHGGFRDPADIESIQALVRPSPAPAAKTGAD